MFRYRGAAVAISLLALAIAGCSKSSQDMSATSANSGLPVLPAALPMQAGPAAPIITAPPVAALPVRRYVGLSRPERDRDAYAYLDRASDIEGEIGDAPPDYDYHNDDGVSPWVWETNGGDYRYAEPVDNGYRYYYYQPGARQPYLVRSRDYSYAYAGGALVAVYALTGALLPPDGYGNYRDQASRYFWRGQQLRQAADARQHRGVVAANWAAQRAQFSAAQASWAAARAQQSAWQDYHAQHDPSQQPGWQQEHQQRQQVAQQFAGWQSRGLAGPPPAALAGPPPAALAVAGPRGAAAAPPARVAPVDRGRPAVPPGPRLALPTQDNTRQIAGRDRAAPPVAARALIPSGAVPAPPARPQPLSIPAQARRQSQASRQLAHEASNAHQQAVAQQEAAARQQMIASVHRQQAMAAKAQWAGRQQAQQREMRLAAQQAQLHALARRRQAEIARVQVSRPEPQVQVRERPRPVVAAQQPAPRFTTVSRSPVPRPEATHAPVAALRPAPAKPSSGLQEAGHPEARHPEQVHAAPGHENHRHEPPG